LRSISSSVSVQGRPAGRRPVISPSPSGPPILGRLGWVIAFNLRTAKGIGHYHPQPALFRVLSHNPSLSAYRFHKLATPIDLALGQLSSLQAGAFDSSWPFRKYAPAVAPIKLGFLEPSAESNSERARPREGLATACPATKKPLAICPACPPGSKLIVYELPAPVFTDLHRRTEGANQKCCSIKGTKGNCGEDTRSAALSQPQADKAVRSIRHQIVVVAQSVLDAERRASRCIGISSARGQHTQGPIILSAHP
jgi:hypothetical protein